MDRQPNYITPEGARRLQEEMDRLRRVDRPRLVEEVAAAAADGDRSENAAYIFGKRKLREIDRRIAFLSKRLETARVVVEEARGDGAAWFGATVEVEDDDGARRRWRIVGEDEADPAAGSVSWRSPLGRALLGRRPGDCAVVRRPAGDVGVTVVAVTWVDPAVR